MLEHPDQVNQPLLALVDSALAGARRRRVPDRMTAAEPIVLPTAADTQAFGRRLAGVLRAGDLVC